MDQLASPLDIRATYHPTKGNTRQLKALLFCLLISSTQPKISSASLASECSEIWPIAFKGILREFFTDCAVIIAAHFSAAGPSGEFLFAFSVFCQFFYSRLKCLSREKR